jgi:hypothetical protein
MVHSSRHADGLQGRVKVKQWGGNSSQNVQSSTHNPAMDTGFVQRGLCVESWQCHGVSPFASATKNGNSAVALN